MAVNGAETTPMNAPPEKGSVGSYLWGNISTSPIRMLAGVAVALAFIILMAVAHGDPQLAVALMTTSGYLPAAFSVLFAVVPATLALVLLQGALWLNLEPPSPRRSIIIATFMWVGIILVTTTYWVVAAAGVIGGALAWWFDLLARTRVAKRGEESFWHGRLYRSTRTLLSVSVIIAIGVVLQQATLDEMWVPPETIAVDSDEVVVGYVVRESVWVSVLVDEPRMLLHLRPSDVAKRRPCRMGPGSPTIGVLIARWQGREDPRPPCR